MTAIRQGRLPSAKRYEFCEPIARAASGTLYRAIDRITRKPVAIKVLASKLSENQTMHRRLAVEFQAVQSLGHPNIVRAIECQCDGETSYLVYEFVESISLAARIEQQGRLSEKESISIIEQIIPALHFAHTQQVIHRDVSPDNILILPDGRAKLTGFGVAKARKIVTQSITQSGTGLGTAHFMAPEQFADAKSVDRRSDIYSVAATLYNALTGQLPFHAKVPMVILTNKELMRLPTVRSLAPEVSERVDRAIFAALDPNPDQRPATCLEFLAHLTPPKAIGWN